MDRVVVLEVAGDEAHLEAVAGLLDEYARGQTGGGKPLEAAVKRDLPRAIKERGTIHAVLAMLDGEAIGVIVAIEGFSTFACKPLLNIHDVYVKEAHRRSGAARQMLVKMEGIARRLGCCKLTLEVLERNAPAFTLYESIGFHPYVLDPALGKATFLVKPLDP